VEDGAPRLSPAKIVEQQARSNIPPFNQSKKSHLASLALLHRRRHARGHYLVHLRFDGIALEHPMLEEFVLMHAAPASLAKNPHEETVAAGRYCLSVS
jgi:hypothetical protein